VIAVLASMEAVGIPLGVLSVFGGALGVGLGLGLQRIASNYVSGFIILLDRSLRIGDLITVDKYSGTVAQIRTRYTVVQALDGTESIIPNEQLVSNTVVNHSYTSTKMRVAIKLTVAGDSDVDRAIEIMCAAAKQEQRVLTDPPPMATLAAFAADGLELELGIWFADPELGTGTVRSDISRRILAEFRRVGIKFATPARDIRLQGGPQGGLQGAASTPAVDADASNRQ
jgi:small-conductance mechanosensitive channel